MDVDYPAYRRNCLAHGFEPMHFDAWLSVRNTPEARQRRGLAPYEKPPLGRPKVRMKARGRMIGCGVPDDAQPGDLVVGNQGAAARVIEVWTSSGLSSCLTLEYAGNHRDVFGPRPDDGRKLYDFS